MCIPLRELYLYSHRGLGNPVWRKSYKGTCGCVWMAMVKNEISSENTGKKLSVKLLWDRYVYSSHTHKTIFLLHSFETASWMDLQRDI